jgi:MerR family transcriptional regulator, redox-sensitive transcriptional activator SoxR
MTIGEMGRRARVPTSTIRYYERRGLLKAYARQSGQRRYRTETLRRLVFIGMMQDAGLSLDEVAVVLDAATAAEWKSVAD